MAVVLTALMTGLMLLVAIGIFGMDAPHAGLLWLLAWLAAVSVAEGTIVMFAVLGASIGQLLAMLIFVYVGLASSGGTLPLQALPSGLRWLAEIEPLRQILAGTRAILYFDAQADAGLARAVTAAALGLVFWLVVGAVVVQWYDRRGFHRMDPGLLAYVGGSVQQYQAPRADARRQDSGKLRLDESRRAQRSDLRRGHEQDKKNRPRRLAPLLAWRPPRRRSRQRDLTRY
jgi:Protein of unknown function (DUF3533)